MAELPQGTVTFLFSDIEGSTRLLASLGESYGDALADHRRLLREAFTSSGGVEVDTQGDAFFYAFARGKDAITAAVAGQRALSSHDFGDGVELKVRMGIHTGEPARSQEGYVGPDVHLGSRICAVAWGGQIVVSSATAALISGLKEVTLRPLGDHGLKDIDQRISLHQAVAPGLREDFPALRSVGAHPTNLPPRLPELIGRDQDIAAVTELVSSPEISVVTLVGPGGTGKTRLSLALAAEMLPSFPDGVFFVDLSALSDPSLVIASIAQVLSLRETPGRSLEESLTDHLGTKQMLLVLDNFEQVMEAASQLSSLLQGAKALKVVVTSREALRISGERVVSVAPLGLPSSGSDLDEVTGSPAVALFVARAQAVKADFSLTPDNAADVAAICRRLDGLPLALELAAARINLLSPSSLLARLDQGLKVLSAGRRDASDRQRTLRGAIAWSYELLSQDEQNLFRRLALFAGGWSLEAAEAVCDRGDLELDVLDGLASLADKSLVRTSAADADRFTMLETIREFAFEKLEESGEAEDIRRAHADHFRALAEEAEPHLIGEHQKEWLDRLEADHDNFRAALTWSLTEDDALAVTLAAHVSRFWHVRGHLSEGRTWLERALEASRDEPTAPALRVYSMLGVIAHVQGDLHAARSFAQEGLAMAHDLHDDRAMMRCTEILALGEMEQGRFAEARLHFEENLQRSGALHDERGVAVTTGNLGLLGMLEGDHEGASALAGESLALHRKLGDAEGMARGTTLLGINALLANEPQRAKSYLREGVEIAADVGHRELIGSALGGFAAAATHTGELERGAILLGAAARIREESGTALEPLEQQLDDTARKHLLDSLTNQRFDELVARGAAMSVGDVLHYIHD
jgi:predicted ATPase/class 3 adenylate cyclase